MASVRAASSIETSAPSSDARRREVEPDAVDRSTASPWLVGDTSRQMRAQQIPTRNAHGRTTAPTVVAP